MSTTLVQSWLLAAEELELKVETRFSLNLKSGATLKPQVRVRDFGGTNGMLVFTDYAEISSVISELIELGYGYSVQNEPPDEELFDKEGFVEMLRDWGWTGVRAAAPAWI